ncbi:MAG TPA: TonB-dependent receptor, partial [Bryobacteraceae bacterium]
PTYGLLLGTGHNVLPQRDLPGIDDNDYITAQELLATLGGYVDSYDQTFNVTSRTSGFVPGAAYLRHFLLNNYALYVQDKWKALPRLSVTLGLRYEIPGIVDESNSLELLPEIQGSLSQTLLSNATLNFAGSSAGRSWYVRNWKEFAPSVGLAWDMFGDGKTAFRASYSISYVNDQAIVAPETATELNSGLQSISYQNGLSNFVSSLPSIPTAPYQIPITLSTDYASNPFNTVGLIDPNLYRPYVQQYYAGIQHEFRRTLFEVRYVGNHMVGGYRSFDLNQVNIQASGFLQDFLRAQNNGFLALARNGTFNPAYNRSIPGSQQLTVFPLLTGGGLLGNAEVRTDIETGQVGDLATLYQTQGLNGSVNFFPNPYALGAELLTNYSSSSYNSLQVEVRRRMHSGLSFQWNYTFSKVLSDADGDSQARTQDFLDIHNASIERSRANFDQTHMFKANAFYELPVGEGHLIHYHPLNRLIGGWTISGVWTLASGAPFSILSSRGTLNRSTANLPFSNSSYYNTASTALTMAQLNGIVKFQMTGNGPYIVSPSAINPADGTGVNTDGSSAFPGQVFFNPGAGTLGVLQRRLFNGPWIFGFDMSALKTVKVRERQALEIRMDAFDALNHTSFWSGDQNINSTAFGLVAGDFGSRLLQFGAHYRF